MRKSLATLIGIGGAMSLAALSATPASAKGPEHFCYHYPIGNICVELVYNGLYSIDGLYENTGASPHTGHIDLYVNSKLAWQGSGTTVPPGSYHRSTSIQVFNGDKVHASWVDKQGTHFVSPVETVH